MATGGRILTGSDHITDQLLSHVSHHVFPATRKQFAIEHLKLRDSQYENIVWDERYSGNISYEILRTWRNESCGVTVGDLIEKLVKWQKKCYISEELWAEIKNYVDPGLLPSPMPATESPGRGFPSSRAGHFGVEGQNRKAYIQKQLRVSLRRRCKNALSTDWLTEGKAKTFPLRDYYVGLKQKKKIKRALKDTSEELERIHDVLDVDVEGAVNVAVIGKAGIGKSSSMAILASDWVDINRKNGDAHNKISQFNFVFVIELRYVNDASSLEQIIIKQHGLKGKQITESEIKSILLEESVLLLLDGYDEYKKGTNVDIDAAIEDTIGNCFLILTSRDGDYISKDILNKMDGEIEITGLSDENILHCATKYLESEDLATDLIEKAKGIGIYDLLHIPIVLLMVSVLYYTKKELPGSLTQIIESIIFMCVDRSTMKHFGKKASEIIGLEHMLYKLGELSLAALKDDTRQLLLSKTHLLEISEDILKLGLLHDSLRDEEASLEEPHGWLMFHHKLFQEFFGGYFAAICLEKYLVLPFHIYHPSCRNVVKFTYGLLQDTSKLTSEIWGRFIDDLHWFMQNTDAGYLRVRGHPDSEGKYKEDRLEWKLKDFKTLMTELSAEKLSEPSIQICHGIIRCRAENFTCESDLLFHSTYEKLTVEIRQSNPTQNDQAATPLVIFLHKVRPEDLIELLKNCNQDGKHLRGFYLNVLDFDNRTTLCDEPISPMVFADHACVEIHGVDFGRIPLKSLIRGMTECDSLDKLSIKQCKSLPKEILMPISRMKNLCELEIKNCRLSEELSAILVDQVKHLEHLQIASFKRSLSPTTDPLTLLQSLVKCPLRILDLSDVQLTGKVSELCKTQHVEFTYLEKLFLDWTKLNADDLVAMRIYIAGRNMPNVTELSLLGMNSEELLQSGLLKSVNENVPNCSVWLYSVPLDHDAYECVRCPEEYESWHHIFDYEYYSNEEVESYMIDVCKSTYNYESKSYSYSYDYIL